ncbi:MAG: hypothetical protein DWQ05_06155 [Calditrichaeota bacterium]|nr:MAG: hypothetical protein DWQ05_06155 [Calditrichota bacterium]
MSNESYIYTIDTAHPPRHPELVEEALLETWMRVRNHSVLRVIKVIHGHGSSGIGGSTKETVLNWAYQHRGRFKNIIPGEQFSLFDATTQEMIAECGSIHDDDCGNANPGITLLWVH